MADHRNQGGSDSRFGVLPAGKESGIVRFCFAKKDETLALALERLGKV
jgi:hypothetical protein